MDTNVDENVTERVGRKKLLTYAQGQLGIHMATVFVGLNLLFFYSDHLGLSPTIIGFVIFCATVLDAVTDPWAGNLSDRARFRMGRRRPFILGGALPMGLFFFLLFSPPKLGPTALIIWFFVAYLLMATGRKFYETAHSAMMPEITYDYDERSRLATYRQGFGTIGDFVAVLLPLGAIQFLQPGAHLSAAAGIGGLLVMLGGCLVFLFLRERPHVAMPRKPLVSSLKAVVRNKPFIIVISSYLLAYMAVTIWGVLVAYVTKYWLGDQAAAGTWLLAYLVGAMVSYPAWLRLIVHVEKRTAFLVAMAMNTACALAFLLMTPEKPSLILLLMVATGISSVGGWISYYSASADVIEIDQEKTGSRQEGAYAGVASMGVKFAVASSFLIAGPLISLIGYTPGADLAGSDFPEHLKLWFALLPAGLFVLAGLVFTTYPVTRAAHRALRERITAEQAAPLAE